MPAPGQADPPIPPPRERRTPPTLDRPPEPAATATIYYAVCAERHLAEAQRILDTHITSSATGRCLACQTPGPCHQRETAVVIFSRTLRLPRRTPGATRPQLVGARRVHPGASR